MEDFFKKIKTEDIINFLVGIVFGLMIVYWFRQLKISKMQMEVLDLEKELLENKIAELQQPLEVEKETETEVKPIKVFPLKKGSKGKEVAALHQFLIKDYDADLEGSEDFESQTFGDTTLDLLKINLKRDTISFNYYKKFILN